MTCTKEDGSRCTSCCEVIHIDGPSWRRVKKGVDRDKIDKLWIQISKRRAKKINPYMFNRDLDDDTKIFLNNAVYFTCKALVKGEGCSVRGTDEHPYACSHYSGGLEYSLTCETDIDRYHESDIIIRSSE